MPTTTVNFNGSGASQPIEALKDRLRHNTLDPRFEEYGDFCLGSNGDTIPRGSIMFWGNFYDYSHVFSITTDDQTLIDELIGLIKANKATEAYKTAKRERAEESRRRAERENRRHR